MDKRGNIVHEMAPNESIRTLISEDDKIGLSNGTECYFISVNGTKLSISE